jgi:5,10-methylenetetrahydrofolate reductase
MQLLTKLEQGRFAILAEIEPPKGVDTSAMTLNASRVKGKVDAVVVPEMNTAVMRMSALGASMILQHRGIETVMQVCCRDRNRLALQADLLAAYGCGIGSVMVVSGEDPSHGDHHQARAVHDIDMLQLLRVMQGLQAGRDMAGIELTGAPRFLVGAKIEAASRERSAELEAESIQRLAEAGARFFITAPVFDLAVLEPLRKRLPSPSVQLIPTVLLLKSVGMARYIARNVPGIHLPEAVIERLQRAPDKVRECTQLAAELARAVKSAGFAGVHITTVGWEHKLGEIIDQM